MRQTCYTAGKNNVALVLGFKEYCACLFFKGAMLKDPAGILVQQTENVQSSRQVRFTSVDQVLEPILRAYIRPGDRSGESRAQGGIQRDAGIRDGRGISRSTLARPGVESRLRSAHSRAAAGLPAAFLYAQTKSATRLARIEKCLKGRGLNDR